MRTQKPPGCSSFIHFHHSALPASVLDEEDDDDDDDEIVGESRDDERSGTRYNVRGWLVPLLTVSLTLTKYSWFHIIFVLGAMYVAMLLTDWWVYRWC